MKAVEARDAWRKATTKDRKFSALRISTTEKPPLGDFAVELPNGLVVVCGLNGVGKTTLLRLVFEALGGRAAGLRDELRAPGSFQVVLDIQGDECVTPLAAGQEVSVILLDAAEECSHLFTLARQPNFDDLIEGFDPSEWSEAEVAEARYVLGKNYTNIRVTEFEDPGPLLLSDPDAGEPAGADTSSEASPAQDDDDAVLALIEVDVDGLTYDFRTMGLGELAALILLWRLRRAEANTVVLLEEPETYLSARASTSLLDVLAKTVNERRLYALVTTHSPGLIGSPPIESIRVLAHTDGGALLRPPASAAELELMLGLPSGPARVVLVEDYTAAAVVTELVGRYAGSWARNLAVLRTNGHERLLSVCEKFPRTEWVHLVGVLDGDLAPPPEPLTWPVLQLPGPQNPDALLRDAILENVAGFATSSGRNADDVAAAIEVHAGLDEHDWFHELSKSIGVEIHTLRRVAIGMWLQDEANETHAKLLVDEIVKVVAGGP